MSCRRAIFESADKLLPHLHLGLLVEDAEGLNPTVAPNSFVDFSNDIVNEEIFVFGVNFY
ncbi:MAG: hypothetical protein D6813_08420 [Calditrichaeota bacterium]|nr:MAG: hypothetical protein D6813_08420 [Calditrichota bacterium]